MPNSCNGVVGFGRAGIGFLFLFAGTAIRCDAQASSELYRGLCWPAFTRAERSESFSRATKTANIGSLEALPRRSFVGFRVFPILPYFINERFQTCLLGRHSGPPIKPPQEI